MRNHVFCEFLLHLIFFISPIFLLRLKIATASPLGKYKCIDAERHALLHFKSYIHKDPYVSLSTWSIAEEEEATNDCCKWSGVTCNNQTGHVTSLDLRFRYLEGKISPSIFNLSYLNHLCLSGNYFNGTIPESIGSLTKLRHLDLSWNHFTGTIPKSISYLTELRYIDLSVNSLDGTIPELIGVLTNLRYLDLSGNFMFGTIPKVISSLTKLRNLYLSHNQFSTTIPIFISSLTELRYLDLSYNYFNGTIPKFIGSMSQLRYLGLSGNGFTGMIPSEFGNLTNLQELSLESLSMCTIVNLDWLSHMSELKGLHMSGTSLAKANHWVDMILSLRKLSHLRLERCDLSQVMSPCSSCVNSSSSSSIVSISLNNNNLNSSMYHWLFSLTGNRLESLDLSGNKLDGIPKYLGNLCNMTSLLFTNNSTPTRFIDFLNNLTGCTSVTLQRLNASSSQFIGSLSNDIQKFSSLQSLDLSNNLLNETISEKVWQLPELRYLDVSFNFFKDAISEDIGRSKISNLYLSNSSLEGVSFEARMQNLSNIEDIDMSFCKLGPHFPKWIQRLKNLTRLNMATTGISDTIPAEFWNAWHSKLIFLNLSSNNISGKVTNFSSTFDPEFSVLDLSSNNFYGPIKNIPSGLERLDLSKNKFYGDISFLCQINGEVVTFLDLSHNSFTGQIPDCLWRFRDLKVLNLGHNNLYGRLPSSIEYLTNLEVLYLYSNKFSGELPLSLKNCTSLTFLELGANEFSGCMPLWIGEKLSRLYTLSIASNNFFGTIPLQLCQLVNLQILDLSMNNLYGTIPSCLNNLTAMVQNELSHRQNAHTYYFLSAVCQKKGQRNFLGKYFDHAIVKWQGNILEFSMNLGLLKSIDLSSNNLSGIIPYELTSLKGLIALNLSNNDVVGEIPHNISEMKNLLTLDLSKNNLSGGLPSSMSQMNLLNYLDVSCNNLSGRIPSGTQLQSFEPSRYSGNVGLCGLPLSKYCSGDKELEVPNIVGQREGEGIDEFLRWFYIGGATGLATGFGITCGLLLVNKRWRKAFFGFLDGSKDWIYIKVMIFIAKRQRDANT